MKIIKFAEIYKIIYPNGKIYIGQDRTHDINYFGSANGHEIEKDFNETERLDMTIRKQIIAQYRNISISDLYKKEKEFIIKYKSYMNTVGYNKNKYRIENENCKNK